MPAGLPGATATVNTTGNPNLGPLVTLDPLSGPKNSPFDAAKIDYTTGTPPGWNATTKLPIKVNDPSNASTGALSTGIGFGSPPVMPAGSAFVPGGALIGFENGNFTDDYNVGQDLPNGGLAANSSIMYIGGGKDSIVAGTLTGPLAAGSNGYPPSNNVSLPAPYTAGFGIAAAGGGGTLPVGGRDQGAGPAYLGAPLKTVTAAGAVAVNAAVEAGWLNQSGGALVTGQSVFGVGTTAIVTPTDVEAPPEEEPLVDDEEEPDL